MKKLDEYIDQARSLPPAPKLLPQLMQLLSQSDVGNREVVDLITYDPALTANVIRIANSVYMGGRLQVANLQEAVTRLGLHEIYKLVASVIGLRSLGVRCAGYGMQSGDLWKHAVTSATAAQLMAQDLGDDACLCFTAALLHDIGKIVLTEVLEDIYTELVERTISHRISLMESEKLLLGVHHAEIGARLLERWNFPEVLVTSVRHHHNPSEATPHERIAACVYLGNVVSNYMGHNYGELAFAQHGREDALNILGINAEDVPKYMIKTFDQFGVVEQLFLINS